MVKKTKVHKKGNYSPTIREKHSKVRKALKKGKGVKAAHYASRRVKRLAARYGR